MFDLVLMQGPSGSGKSKVATMMKDAAIDVGWNATVLSADDYFRDESGNYNFDPRMLNRAHMVVITKAFRLMNHAKDTKEFYRIIIDNTNMEAWEWELLYTLATSLGARRIILQRADILTPYSEMNYEDKDELARLLFERQTKNMESYTVILRQLLKYEEKVHDYVEVRTFMTGL